MAAVTAPRGQPASEMLFRPIRVGPFTLPHRIVMAPLTRSRARTPGNVPTELNACYYAQRASAALIISEATQVSMQGQGYAWTPGIHSREQVEGWRVITDAVHDAGGRMFIQLWHVGRISHPALQPDHMLPVAPSPITPAGKAFIENELGEGELVPFVRPRGLELEELPYIARQYARGARNAQLANADGVEVHGANGYLLEQFLETGTNRRDDATDGAIEGVVRCSTLFYMTYTGINTSSSPVVPELVHRYDLASHSAIGAPITIGTAGTWGGAEGEIFYGGWDVSADGAHIAYQSLASTVTGGGSGMTQSSHWYSANADGSSAVSILPSLTSNDPAYLAISPDGAQVAVTSADPAPNVASGPMSGGATRFYDSPNGFSRPAWRADSQAFYASTLQYIDSSDTIAQFPLGTGAHATGSTAITPGNMPVSLP